ncbi:hypothetical protein O6H91_12G037000 [Diphasiastrum complanatum]|uniref:Uncharacterized protein n=1 Tax=Diphasiastrum complanatum TaxID=34168 RepID=A0ACC2C0G8_DIPCM|nr:hypothetical protein O6H91_Y565800 [Diphasiastrum complanatum]KAJ7535518.1 hypothetical protein O6H91_12G037000 [Diphasiastrum complanatum]
MAEEERQCLLTITMFAWFLLPLILASFANASPGDRDPLYSSCVEHCARTGCVGRSCFSVCNVPINGGGALGVDGEEVLKKPLDLGLFSWDCTRECRYQCMLHREAERQSHGLEPVKYHGKWPFDRILGLQEPASVVFSLLNLLAHILGVVSFLVLLYHKLPLRQHGKGVPYYEYAGLWTIYALFAINSWFWSAIFHARDMNVTERLDYCSAVALIGLSLILAIIRTGNLRVEAARVMASAPIIAFISTHILYLNFYEFDYGLNMKVCIVMGVLQLLLWSLWAAYTQHPARLKLWIVVLGGALAMLLEVYDFPPYKGIFDAHSIWHAVTVPLTYLWWSFIRDDALYRTMDLFNRGKIAKKVE